MFKNYEEFTKSFNEENTKKEALLLLEIQDWIIKFIIGIKMGNLEKNINSQSWNKEYWRKLVLDKLKFGIIMRLRNK